jgi:hypothetical protein
MVQSQTFHWNDVSWGHGTAKGEYKFNWAETEDIAAD